MGAHQKRFALLAVLGLTFIGATSCGVFETPFSLTVNEVDETQPQQPAAIQLSQPQIYARETLVNERRDEAAFINELLEKSTTSDVTFEPEIARNLKTITEMRNAFGLTFDPSAGQAFAREDAIAAAQAERDLVNARIELVTAQRQLRALEESDPGETQPPDPDGGTEEDATERTERAELQNQITTLKTTVADQVAKIKALESRVSTLKTQLDSDKLFKEATATKAVTSSPLEEFLDRSTYRRALNAALAEVKLDDLHDKEGNSLYRLQFRSTVLPGKAKDKWGIARLTLVPPRLHDEDLRRLYNAWLSHVTNRLNRVVPGTRSELETDEQYILLAAAGLRVEDDLFDIARIPFSPGKFYSEPAISDSYSSGDDDAVADWDSDCWGKPPYDTDPRRCQFISIAVRPGLADRIETVFARNEDVLLQRGVAAMGLLTTAAKAQGAIGAPEFVNLLNEACTGTETAIDKLSVSAATEGGQEEDDSSTRFKALQRLIEDKSGEAQRNLSDLGFSAQGEKGLIGKLYGLALGADIEALLQASGLGEGKEANEKQARLRREFRKLRAEERSRFPTGIEMRGNANFLLLKASTVTASIQGLGDRNILPRKLRRRASILLNRLEQAIEAAQGYQRLCGPVLQAAALLEPTRAAEEAESLVEKTEEALDLAKEEFSEKEAAAEEAAKAAETEGTEAAKGAAENAEQERTRAEDAVNDKEQEVSDAKKAVDEKQQAVKDIEDAYEARSSDDDAFLEESQSVPPRFKKILVQHVDRFSHCRLEALGETIDDLRDEVHTSKDMEAFQTRIERLVAEMTGGWSDPPLTSDFTPRQIRDGLDAIHHLISRDGSLRTTLQEHCQYLSSSTWQDFHDHLQRARGGYDRPRSGYKKLRKLDREVTAGAVVLTAKLREGYNRQRHEGQALGERAWDGFVANGNAYAYAAGPVEHVQRLSTIAGASNTTQLAVALSAVFATEGLAVEDAFEFTRIAVGNVSAIERVPLVVGYSDRSDPSGAAEFGWLFGPPVKVDTEDNELELVQGVRNYPVFADVSLPGWWPKVSFRLETAWVQNWHNTGEPLRFTGNKRAYADREVILPLNRADLDGLTNLIASRVTGPIQRFARIGYVEPTSVSACAEEISFHVYGANVWRSTKVTFAGLEIPEDDIEVLPDMEGLRIKLDMRNLPRRPPIRQPLQLVLSTRNGSDDYPIRVVGSKEDGLQHCGVEATGDLELVFNHRPNEGPPLVTAVYPDSVSACARDALFVLSGNNLYPDPANQAAAFALLGGEAETKVKSIQTLGASPSNSQVQLKFDVTKLGLSARGSTIPLTYVTRNGVAEAQIRILHGCKPQDSAINFAFRPGSPIHINTGTAPGPLKLLLTGPAIPDDPHSFDLMAMAYQIAGFKRIADRSGIGFGRKQNDQRTDALTSPKIDFSNLGSGAVGAGKPVNLKIEAKASPNAKKVEIASSNPLYVYNTLGETKPRISVAGNSVADKRKITSTQLKHEDDGTVPSTESVTIHLTYPVNLHTALAYPGGTNFRPEEIDLELSTQASDVLAALDFARTGQCRNVIIDGTKPELVNRQCDYKLTVKAGVNFKALRATDIVLKFEINKAVREQHLPKISGAFDISDTVTIAKVQQ